METEKQRGKRIRDNMSKLDTGFMTDLELKETINTLSFLQGFFENEQIVLTGIGTYLSHFELIANFRQIEYERKDTVS